MADLDNEMDAVSVDETGCAVEKQVKSTKVSLFCGNTPKNFKINSVTRKYNNGSSEQTITASDVTVSYVAAVSGARAVGVTYKKGAKTYGVETFYIVISPEDDLSKDYTLRFTINAVKGKVYNLFPSVDIIKAERDSNNNLVVNGQSVYTVTCRCRMIDPLGQNEYPLIGVDGNVKRSVDGQVVASEYYIMYRQRTIGSGDFSGDYTYYKGTYNNPNPSDTGVSINLNGKDGIEFILCTKKDNGTPDMIIDRETVPVVADGNNGENAIRLDLDNEMDVVSLDGDGKVRFDRTITVRARVYDGATQVTGGVSLPYSDESQMTSYLSSIAIDGSQLSADTESGAVVYSWNFSKGTAITTKSAQKTLKVKYNNVVYSAVFSFSTTEADTIWQVIPNPSKVSFSLDTSTNSLTPTNIFLKCGYTKYTGGGSDYVETATLSSGQIMEDGSNTGMYIYFRSKTNNSWSSWNMMTTNGIQVASTTTVQDYELCITTRTPSVEDGILDREVVPVVKDGKTPIVSIRQSDKHWIIDGVDTGVKAEGDDGTGVSIKGGVRLRSLLEDDGHVTPQKADGTDGTRIQASVGDCYMCNDPNNDNRHLFIWTGSVWNDLGEFKGAPGESSYMHIAYADEVSDFVNGVPTSIKTDGVSGKFLKVYDGKEHDWWGFCTDNNAGDPDSFTAYKWNYMKGKDGNGVEFIYLLTKGGLTPGISEESFTLDGVYHDQTKDEFLPKETKCDYFEVYPGTATSVICWSDNPPASPTSSWSVLWEASRKKTDGVWGNFCKPTRHAVYSAKGDTTLSAFKWSTSGSVAPAKPSKGQ